MSSIPFEILLRIEAERPDLQPLIHDLMSTSDILFELHLEKRLAVAYLSGSNDLTPEETLDLSACCDGQPYGERDLRRLH